VGSLRVPFRQQISDAACGVAALEMVIKYYSQASPFSQRKFVRRLGEHEPHGSGKLRISTQDLVNAACARRFLAGWGRIKPDVKTLMRQLDCFLNAGVPVIACQRYTDAEPQLGHFRVIYGLEGQRVMIHDPCPKTGGRDLCWSVETLFDYWRQTGLNVTGGVAIWIAKERPKISALLPDQPNLWDNFKWPSDGP
jgi:Papain-like cysteine protease AvrRpt2